MDFSRIVNYAFAFLISSALIYALIVGILGFAAGGVSEQISLR